MQAAVQVVGGVPLPLGGYAPPSGCLCPSSHLQVVGAVLRGAAHPDREVAEITFNFWYVLSEELAGGGRVLSDEQRRVGRELVRSAACRMRMHALEHLSTACSLERPISSLGFGQQTPL